MDRDGDAEMEDDMGSPLATPSLLAHGKRCVGEESEAEPARSRPRLQHVEAREDIEFDVSEVFSCPRVSKMAAAMGLRRGYALDVKEVDEITARRLNADLPRDRAFLRKLQRRRKSRLLVASPTEMDSELREGALSQLRVAVDACRTQHKLGLYFILEQPLAAASWQ